MTWFEIYQQARLETKEVVPVAWLGVVIAMQWMSTAQFKLQEETSACWKTKEITLDAANTSGLYDLPCGFKQLNGIRYSEAVDSFPYSEVLPRSYQDLNRIIGQQLVGSQIYAAITPQKKLLVYPASSGVVSVTYMPYLRSYSPSNKDEWTGYGNDPTKRMEVEGPEPCFAAAEHGIKEYLKAMIFASSPGGLSRYRTEYELAISEFAQAIAYVQSDLTDYTHTTLPPPNMAGLF